MVRDDTTYLCWSITITKGAFQTSFNLWPVNFLLGSGVYFVYSMTGSGIVFGNWLRGGGLHRPNQICKMTGSPSADPDVRTTYIQLPVRATGQLLIWRPTKRRLGLWMILKPACHPQDWNRSGPTEAYSDGNRPWKLQDWTYKDLSIIWLWVISHLISEVRAYRPIT